MRDRIKVAIGVVFNSVGKVLISKRREDVHLPGVWEFPGGKVEPNESTNEALNRELFEEVGINVESAKLLVNFPYQFDDKAIEFSVWCIEQFKGEATNQEGQCIEWVALDELSQFEFPESNQVIFKALSKYSA